MEITSSAWTHEPKRGKVGLGGMQHNKLKAKAEIGRKEKTLTGQLGIGSRGVELTAWGED